LKNLFSWRTRNIYRYVENAISDADEDKFLPQQAMHSFGPRKVSKEDRDVKPSMLLYKPGVSSWEEFGEASGKLQIGHLIVP
jgi:hypothetical protein